MREVGSEMTSDTGYLEFLTREGNKSYVRGASVVALYHDGQATRIVVSDTLSGTPIHTSLSSSEMPNVLFKRLQSGR
jgi:hypothetical protein